MDAAKRLIKIGTGSGDLFDDQRIVIINVTTLLAMASQLVFSLVFYLKDYHAPAIFNLICLIGYCGVIALNHQEKTRFSALTLILVSTIQLFSLPVFFVGKETGIHYYAFAVISITFLIARRKDRLPMIVGALLLAGGGFVFAEYGSWHSSLIVPPQPQLAKLFHLMATTGTVAIITVVIFTFYFMLDKAQALLAIEHQRAEDILLNMLPPSIARRLKDRHATIADDHEDVAILFADIVGFTELSERLSPKCTVEILNSVFSLFDGLVEKHQLEKIKTIGDAYMVAGGLTVPREDSLESIADFSLEMMEALAQFNTENNQSLEIRVGIHVGAVVAGVIGRKGFVFDIWGDTVNTASRMESHSLPGQIQVSEQTYERLNHMYSFRKRGFINVKGKGDMNTYLLQGKIALNT